MTLAVDVPHPRSGVLVQAYRDTVDGALPTVRQSSAMLRGLADADGLLIVPEGGNNKVALAVLSTFVSSFVNRARS